MRTLLPLRMGRTAGTVLLPALSRRCPRWRMATSRSTSNVLTSRYIRQRQFNDVCIIILSDTATGDAMHFLAVMVFICWPKAHSGVFVCTHFFFRGRDASGDRRCRLCGVRQPNCQLLYACHVLSMHSAMRAMKSAAKVQRHFCAVPLEANRGLCMRSRPCTDTEQTESTFVVAVHTDVRVESGTPDTLAPDRDHWCRLCTYVHSCSSCRRQTRILIFGAL